VRSEKALRQGTSLKLIEGYRSKCTAKKEKKASDQKFIEVNTEKLLLFIAGGAFAGN